MKTIDIPAQTHPWSTVLAVAQHFSCDEWMLAGGLMVQAHAMLHGLNSRATTDADFLLDFLTYERIASQMARYLGDMGFKLSEDSLTGYATRLENLSHSRVDVLVTDYVYGKKKRENAFLAGKPLCRMPAGGQALARKTRIRIRYEDIVETIQIPDVLGAVMLKSAAWDVDKTARRYRHLSDAALLLSLMDFPETQVERLHSPNDRRRILRLHELLTIDSDYWDDLDLSHRQNGLDALDTLTDWAQNQ